ncbi:hypothetical protein PCIT_a3498 [Pseudoalteromonas citrea]|uniref:Adhesin domain-containing protein n=2 Tax=Pseudoalteromonas citrea TaxID=43655 RepID=A0AAD4FR84_9GAMM|nr:hypothetical protein [Pseudoalteromonas citrea]KAF7768962.1 hypothetical protein PCIT_a3498 [Pseudoalteromonas citrea]
MKKFLLLTAAATSLSFNVMASESHTIKQSFAANNNQQLEIDFPVGSLDMTSYDGDKIEVSIRLEAQQNNSWFNSNVNLDEIALNHHTKSDTLSLKITEKDLKQYWQVKAPSSMQLDIEVGVGNVKISELANSADIEVGVGKVSIDTNEADFQSISLESGVGTTSVKGLVNAPTQHKKITRSETLYHGKGTHRIEVEVGVGDIKVQH